MQVSAELSPNSYLTHYSLFFITGQSKRKLIPSKLSHIATWSIIIVTNKGIFTHRTLSEGLLTKDIHSLDEWLNEKQVKLTWKVLQQTRLENKLFTNLPKCSKKHPQRTAHEIHLTNTISVIYSITCSISDTHHINILRSSGTDRPRGHSWRWQPSLQHHYAVSSYNISSIILYTGWEKI